MTTIFVVCGKVNYTNLSRYSGLSERTYRRHFKQGIGFESLNQALIEPLRRDETVQIGVVDCTFIEFIFRDARQFTGLTDCQARSPEAIDTHVNASLMALNLAKVALQQNQTDGDSLSFSLASFKRLALNQHLLDLFIDLFELEPTLIKSHANYQKLLDYGAIAS